MNWFRRLLDKLPSPSSSCPWSVEVTQTDLVVSDGEGSGGSIPLAEIEKVEIATDSSGPWGYDVVYLIFGDDHDQPRVVYVMEAQGADAMLEWLEGQKGYRDEEVIRAMGSTTEARFIVYERI